MLTSFDKTIVTGIGTGVGKTVVSAIFATILKGDYWKPIECGTESDTCLVKEWLSADTQTVHSPSYSFKHPSSPHHAASLEKRCVDLNSIMVPKTERPLVIETVGGIFVPLNIDSLAIDLFQKWNFKWIVVSQNYLGSINHTLLTIEMLKLRQQKIAAIVFNGTPNPSSEEAILKFSKIDLVFRLQPEKKINKRFIQQKALQWMI